MLSKAGYRCQYCGRHAFDGVVAGKRRAFRMVVDHQHPVHLGGQSYRYANSTPACWSCNLLKAGLTRSAFETELKSLAEAVVRNRKI